MVNCVSSDYRPLSAAKGTGASARLLASPADMSIVLSGKTSLKDSVKLSKGMLPKAYMNYKSERRDAIKNTAISGSITVALVAYVTFLAPPVAALFLTYAFIPCSIITGIVSAPLIGQKGKLAEKIGELEPQAQKEAIAQIRKADPTLAARLEKMLTKGEPIKK